MTHATAYHRMSIGAATILAAWAENALATGAEGSSVALVAPGSIEALKVSLGRIRAASGTTGIDSSALSNSIGVD